MKTLKHSKSHNSMSIAQLDALVRNEFGSRAVIELSSGNTKAAAHKIALHDGRQVLGYYKNSVGHFQAVVEKFCFVNPMRYCVSHEIKN